MSDYLGSLVTRALALSPTIRPRPVSVFEPTTKAPHGLQFQSVTQELSNDVNGSITPGTTIESNKNDSASKFVMSENDSISSSAQVQPPLSNVRYDTIDSTESGIHIRLRESEIHPENERDSGSSGFTHQPASELSPRTGNNPLFPSLTADRNEPTESLAGAGKQSNGEKEIIEQVRLAPNGPSESFARKSIEVHQHISTLPPARVDLPNQQSNVSLIQPLSMPSLKQSHSQKESVSEIHVTIGRVEIKAMNPSPGRQKTQPKPSQVLSLDDYLRNRAGGRNR